MLADLQLFVGAIIQPLRHSAWGMIQHYLGGLVTAVAGLAGRGG